MPLTDLVHNQLLDAAQCAMKTEILASHCAYSHCKRSANYLFHIITPSGKHSFDFFCFDHMNHVLKKAQEREDHTFFLPLRAVHVAHQSRIYLN